MRVATERTKMITEKTFVQGKTKIRYLDIDGSVHTHINFGTYKKHRKADTYTIYDSIMENDKGYCEIWLDKQNGLPIGVEIMWHNKGVGRWE